MDENDLKFTFSLRGKFVMNEVIQYGLTVIEGLPDRDKPVSDIEDIKYIRDTVFKFI